MRGCFWGCLPARSTPGIGESAVAERARAGGERGADALKPSTPAAADPKPAATAAGARQSKRKMANTGVQPVKPPR